MTTLSGVVVKEWRDRRIIAALRFVDATTGGNVRQPLTIEAPDASLARRPSFTLVRNLSGHYVLTAAPGFDAYRETFNLDDLAVAPANTTLDLAISDRSGQYLPRRVSLFLPRNPAIDSTSVTSEQSLFQPARIALYPSPNASVNPGWAVLRSTVINAATSQRLPWAIVVVTAAALPTSTPLITQADWRGEALIAIPGIPITTWATGPGDGPGPPPVTATEIDATLEVVFDPTLTSIPETADLSQLADPNPTYQPNPEQLNSNRSGRLVGSVPFTLASGRDLSHRLAVTLTPV